MSSTIDVLDIPARKNTTGRRTVIHVRAKKDVRAVSVVFNSGHQKGLSEAADTVRSVVDSFADFPNSAYDDPNVGDGIVREDSPQDLEDLTSKDDRVPSALQRIRSLSILWLLSPLGCPV